MRWDDLLQMVILIAFAACFAWLGGLTRTYSAFGGEDVAALCLIGYAVRTYIEEGKEER